MQKNSVSLSYIVITFLGLLGIGLLDNSRGPFFGDLMQDLSLSDVKGSLFFMVPSSVMFFASFMASRAIQSFGIIKTMRFSFLLIAVGFFGFSYSENLFHIVACGFCFGVGFGLLTVVQNLGIDVAAPAQYRGRLLSALHSNYALASLMAPLMINWLVGDGYDWRQSFRLFALLPFIVFSLSFLVKPIPGDRPKMDSSRISLFHPLMIFVGGIFAFYLWCEIQISSRLVLYIRRSQDVAIEGGNQYLALFFFGLLAMRIAGSFVPTAGRKMQVLFGCLGTTLVFSILGLTYDPLFLSLCGASVAIFIPTFLDLLSEEFPDHINEVISIGFAWSAVGVVVMHFAVGLVSDLYGIAVAMYFIPVVCGVSGAMLLFLKSLKAKWWAY